MIARKNHIIMDWLTKEFFVWKFVYRLCRHMVYKFSDIRPGTGAPGDTAPPVLVHPYDDMQNVRLQPP